MIICCHEVPELGLEDERIELLAAGFDLPGCDIGDRRRDKGRKVLAGLLRAREYAPCHAMVLDSDDCVSNRLAAHVAGSAESNGWYFAQGYFYQEGQRTVHFERRRFHLWCGSSHILRPEHLDLPTHPVEDWYLPHRPIAARMRKRGTPLEPLPFPGAVYNVSHGDNFRDYAPIFWPRHPVRRFVRGLVYHRELTPAIRDEFGLYPLDTGA
jgi:hypothetical protein